MQIFTQKAGAPLAPGQKADVENRPLLMPPPQFNAPELEAICRAVGFYIASNPSIQSAKSAQMKLEFLASGWRKYVKENS